jgi:endoglucanase
MVLGMKHPNVEFGKPIDAAIDIDPQFDDEWLWAAAEMFVTSKNKMYFDVVEQNIDASVTLPSMNNVAMLAYYSVLRYADNIPYYASDIVKLMRDRLLRIAEQYLAHISSNAFSTVMGQSKNDFVRGSNAVAANQGILLINAYLATGDERYVSGSMTNIDYLLGRNATGYCFCNWLLWDQISHSSLLSHCRWIAEPVPGLLVAGPPHVIRRSSRGSVDIETSYRTAIQITILTRSRSTGILLWCI